MVHIYAYIICNKIVYIWIKREQKSISLRLEAQYGTGTMKWDMGISEFDYLAGKGWERIIQMERDTVGIKNTRNVWKNDRETC